MFKFEKAYVFEVWVLEQRRNGVERHRRDIVLCKDFQPFRCRFFPDGRNKAYTSSCLRIELFVRKSVRLREICWLTDNVEECFSDCRYR